MSIELGQNEFYWEKRHQTESVKNNQVSEQAIKISDLFEQIPIKKLLEIGFGDATDALFFDQKEFDYTGTDISLTAIQKAISKAPSRLKFIQADTRTISSNFDSTFNCVFARLSLHYFSKEETESIFQQIYNLLKNDGVFVFAVRSTDDPECVQAKREGTKIEGTDNMFQYGGLTRHYFTKEYIEELLRGRFEIKSLDKITQNQYGKGSVFYQVFAKKV